MKKLSFPDLIQQFDTIKNYPHLNEEEYIKRDYWIVQKNNQWGVIDLFGNPVSEFKYSEILDFAAGFAQVRINDKWGFINKNGKEIGEIKFSKVFDFVEDRAIVEVDGMKYFINEVGNLISKGYDEVEEFSEGYAVVGNENGEYYQCPDDSYMDFCDYGYIDKEGKEICALSFSAASSFQCGLALVIKDNRYEIIDDNFNTIAAFPDFNSVEQWGENIYRVELDGEYGLVDGLGKKLTDIKYKKIGLFSEGFATVEVGWFMRGGYINTVGKEITELKYTRIEKFEDGVALVQIDNKYGLVDVTGNEILPVNFDYIFRMAKERRFCRVRDKIPELSNYFITSKKDEKKFYRRDNFEMVEIISGFKDVNPIWEYTEDRNEVTKKTTGLFIIKFEDHLKLINENGKILSDAEYDDISNVLFCGMIRVSSEGKNIHINVDGKVVDEIKYNELIVKNKKMEFGDWEEKLSILFPNYSTLWGISDELYVMEINNQIKIIDYLCNEIASFNIKFYERLSNFYLIFYREDFSYDFFDIRTKSLRSQSIFNKKNDLPKVFRIKTRQGWQYLNNKGQRISDRIFEASYGRYSQGYDIVKWNGEFGFIIFDNPQFFKETKGVLTNYEIIVHSSDNSQIDLLTKEEYNELESDYLQERAQSKVDAYPSSGDYTNIDGEWIHDDGWQND